MTVKELKEALDGFPDNLVVMIPDYAYPWTTPDEHLAKGVNEEDGCLFILGD